MISFSTKAMCLALFALGTRGRQSFAQEGIGSCVDLIAAVEGAPGSASFDLSSDISCLTQITIADGQDVTINGNSHTVAIGVGFLADLTAQSLFENQPGGTLTLNDVTVVQEAGSVLDAGVRAVYNEGTITLNSCVFTMLNLFVESFLPRGGVIYTDSIGEEVTISDSTFTSNIATQKGGAICAVGSDILTVTRSTFKGNEAIADSEGDGAGGDIYAGSEVTLTVQSSTFTDSTAEYGGAAIECCGASITDCTFTGTESFLDSDHYGALLVGRPDGEACPNELVLDNSTFTGCTVGYTNGAGGSLAVFDTTAVITDCSFDSSQGTAVLFESSSESGAHFITMDYCLLTYNTNPSQKYATNDSSQGVAVVVQNTGVGEGDDPVLMGEFTDIYCFANSPYECEVVYALADITHSGEFKCQFCDESGERKTSSGTADDNDDDSNSLDGPQVDSNSTENAQSASPSSASSDSRDYLIIGLAAGLAGVVVLFVGCMVVWKCRYKNDGTAPSAAPQGQPGPVVAAPQGQPEAAVGAPPGQPEPAVAPQGQPEPTVAEPAVPTSAEPAVPEPAEPTSASREQAEPAV